MPTELGRVTHKYWWQDGKYFRRPLSLDAEIHWENGKYSRRSPSFTEVWDGCRWVTLD